MTEKERLGWRNGIVTRVYNNKKFRSYAAKLKPALVEEILSELSNSLLSMNIDKLIELHMQNVLNAYCMTIINNMVWNASSPFNKMYSSNHEQIEVAFNLAPPYDSNDFFLSDESFDLIEAMKAFTLSKNHEDYNMFYRWRFGGEIFQEIADSTGNSKTSVFNTVKAIEKIVIRKFKKQYDVIRNN